MDKALFRTWFDAIQPASFACRAVATVSVSNDQGTFPDKARREPTSPLRVPCCAVATASASNDQGIFPDKFARADWPPSRARSTSRSPMARQSYRAGTVRRGALVHASCWGAAPEGFKEGRFRCVRSRCMCARGGADIWRSARRSCCVRTAKTRCFSRSEWCARGGTRCTVPRARGARVLNQSPALGSARRVGGIGERPDPAEADAHDRLVVTTNDGAVATLFDQRALSDAG